MSGRNHVLLFILVTGLCLASSHFLSGQTDERKVNRALLEHRNAEDRAATARLLGTREERWAVKFLIQRLDDEAENVRKEAHRALKKITKKDLPADKNRWQEWYKSEGKEKYPAVLETGRSDPANTAEEYLNLSILVAGISFGIVILFVVAFGIMGGYKLKQIKEITKRAEENVAQAEEVQEATDDFTDELEQKKVEMHEYISELKEEKERELDRHSELLSENNEQKIREEMRTLRERAEKEVEHTLNDLQEGVGQRLKQDLRELKNDLRKELKEAHEQFNQEAETQRTFLEASLLDIADKPEEALKKYDEVLEMKPDHRLAMQRKGKVLRKKGRYETAVEEFERALEQSPESPSILYDLASTYAKMNRKEKMLSNLKKSISIEPEYKDEALNDESFKDYWDDREFRDLAEA